MTDATPRPRLVYAALGDSATVGIGDARPGGDHRGWSRLLAGWLADTGHDVEHVVLARIGARADDVHREQLPVAEALAPDVATVLVGGNDLLRGDFDADRVTRRVDDVVRRLQARGTLVVVVCTPDPSLVAPMPSAVARVLHHRAAVVNEGLTLVARRRGALLVDPEDTAGCYDRSTWSFDRMHPSPRGHRMLACIVADALTFAGVLAFPQGQPADNVPDELPRLAQTAWLLRNGLPWAAKRMVDLAPTLVALVVKDAVGERVRLRRTTVVPAPG